MTGPRASFLRWPLKGNTQKIQQSATPILDLLEPLPKPSDSVITGRFAFPFLTFVGMIVVAQNYSFLIVPFCFVLLCILNVAIHESGHILAGWWVGLRFRGVEAGPITLRRIRGRWSVRLRPRIHRGQAEMRIERICRVRKRLIIHTISGPATSYVVGCAAFVVGEKLRVADYSGWSTFLEFLGAFSFFTAILSSIPFSTPRGGNDAYILRQLLTSRKAAIAQIASHALYFVATTSPGVHEFDQRWARLLRGDVPAAMRGYYDDSTSYQSAEDTAVAAQLLEQLLRNSSHFDEELRNFAIAEAAYFTAWRSEIPTHAEIWYRRIPNPGWLDPLAAARLEIAMLCSRKQYAEALSKCESVIHTLEAHSNGPASKEFERQWIKWKDLILEKMQKPASQELIPVQ